MIISNIPSINIIMLHLNLISLISIRVNAIIKYDITAPVSGSINTSIDGIKVIVIIFKIKSNSFLYVIFSSNLKSFNNLDIYNINPILANSLG